MQPVTWFNRIQWLAIALVIVVSDQVTKALVQKFIPEHATIPVIPHFFNLIHVKNAGAVFGLFADSPAPWKTGALIGASSLLLAMLIIVLWRSWHIRWLTGMGFALVLGVALSNLLDRFRYGRVVDFLDFYARGYHWATFNLADSAIVVGASLLMFEILFLQ